LDGLVTHEQSTWWRIEFSKLFNKTNVWKILENVKLLNLNINPLTIKCSSFHRFCRIV
jgi:hypothetical protein